MHVSSAMPPAEWKQQCSHEEAHCDTANKDTENLSQNAHVQIDRKFKCSENMKQLTK
jgi:hypothetical protein